MKALLAVAPFLVGTTSKLAFRDIGDAGSSLLSRMPDLGNLGCNSVLVAALAGDEGDPSLI